jgi:hypothetical protein
MAAAPSVHTHCGVSRNFHHLNTLQEFMYKLLQVSESANGILNEANEAWQV